MEKELCIHCNKLIPFRMDRMPFLDLLNRIVTDIKMLERKKEPRDYDYRLLILFFHMALQEDPN